MARWQFARRARNPGSKQKSFQGFPPWAELFRTRLMWEWSGWGGNARNRYVRRYRKGLFGKGWGGGLRWPSAGAREKEERKEMVLLTETR